MLPYGFVSYLNRPMELICILEAGGSQEDQKALPLADYTKLVQLQPTKLDSEP